MRPWPTGAAGRLLVLTDAAQLPHGSLVDRVQALVDAGARVVLLRERHLPAEERAELGERLAGLVHDVGGLLLWASPHRPPSGVPSAQPSGVLADGCHDPATELTSSVTATSGWRGASVHTPDEMRLAVSSGYHYATVSPWALTVSKPGYGPALGPAGTQALVNPSVRCFALGGVVPLHCADIHATGAFGVAVMGELMRTSEPRRRVAEYLEAIEAAWGHL